ncbi:MAG: HDOD domain-containing protein [Candidatus Krumholzibacteriia bacterium]
MATSTPELQDILTTLDRLQTRVRELTDPAAVPAAPGPEQAAAPQGVPAGDLKLMARLSQGMSDLTHLQSTKEVPGFFVKFVRETGLRLLLLKRWTSGLQVYVEEGLNLPEEARRKRPDGRAPIPVSKTDIFAAVGEEINVYAGPVPTKNFPLDLTLMLGRNSRERQIIILPLHSQNHWNTFLYIDAGDHQAAEFAVAETLARYALARMCLLGKGEKVRQGRVASLRREEMARRRERDRDRSRVQPREQGDDHPSGDVAGESTPEPQGNQEEGLTFVRPPKVVPPAGSTWEPDPFREIAPHTATHRPASAPEPEPEAGPQGVPVQAGGRMACATETGTEDYQSSAALPETPQWDPLGPGGKPLTPHDVLRQSGELPALPKAACHIMAVIEDPKTTATSLEKALAMDQALTAKVLRIANSPFYGAVREIKTVSEAIVRLGFVAIRNWTLVTAARSVFLAPGAGLLYRKIWKQSVLSAMAGQLVAQAAGRMDADSVFIGGLMQNIGQLVLARNHPELFQEILMESTNTRQPYHSIERRILGFDHGELGALLIREWNLSQELEEAVLWHHRFEHPDARNARVAAMIALGEEVAWCSGAEEGEAAKAGPDQEAELEEPSAAARFLGFGPGTIAKLRRQAAELTIDPHFFN